MVWTFDEPNDSKESPPDKRTCETIGVGERRKDADFIGILMCTTSCHVDDANYYMTGLKERGGMRMCADRNANDLGRKMSDVVLVPSVQDSSINR